MSLFINDPATTEIYTLSLHDALPISGPAEAAEGGRTGVERHQDRLPVAPAFRPLPQHRSLPRRQVAGVAERVGLRRSEEHTSELQSQSNLVCRLLLEKKKGEV